MYNTDFPRRADLPTSAQLRRSTIIAAASACVILVAVVLPSEYATDPTGIGRLLGLTQMGEIKTQLAVEVAADAPASDGPAPASALDDDPVTRRLDRIEALLSMQREGLTPGSLASEQPATVPVPEETASAVATGEPEPVLPAGRADEVSFSLVPGQGAEIKLVMREGARARFVWSSSGGPVNFDAHGDAPSQSTTYEKGRGVTGDEGVLEAAFDGNHGWFWRNRGRTDVTVTLRTDGDYAGIKRVL
jgi:hypothetical protein